MIAWCGSDYPVESQYSFSAVSVQFQCSFVAISNCGAFSGDAVAVCGPTAVPLRFHCGSSAVPVRFFGCRWHLKDDSFPPLLPPPSTLHLLCSLHTHTHTHTHTQTTSTIIIIIVIHLNKLEVNLKCSMAFARPTISWTGSIATPPLSLSSCHLPPGMNSSHNHSRDI